MILSHTRLIQQNVIIYNAKAIYIVIFSSQLKINKSLISVASNRLDMNFLTSSYEALALPSFDLETVEI